MTEPSNADSPGFLAFAKRVTKLEGDLIDTQARLRALEKRFEDFTLGRFSPPGAPALLGDQRIGVNVPTVPRPCGDR